MEIKNFDGETITIENKDGHVYSINFEDGKLNVYDIDTQKTIFEEGGERIKTYAERVRELKAQGMSGGVARWIAKSL